jgi:hypothetical protein
MIPDGQCLINYCPIINHVCTVYMTTRYFEIVKSTVFNQISHENKTKLAATAENYGPC